MVDEKRCNGGLAPELGNTAGLSNPKFGHVGYGDKSNHLDRIACMPKQHDGRKDEYLRPGLRSS